MLINEKSKRFNLLALLTRSFSLLLIVFILFSCEEKSYLPKPRAYPKVDFPKKELVPFTADYCNLSFQMPSYFKIEKQENFFEEKAADECWFDLQIPQLNGSLHCTYSPVEDRVALVELINDSYELAQKHIVKANFIDDKPIGNENVQGILYDIEGPTATHYQFFLTDSVSNYFQASLYFNNPPNPDSMAPIISYVKEDLITLIETFEFK